MKEPKIVQLVLLPNTRVMFKDGEPHSGPIFMALYENGYAQAVLMTMNEGEVYPCVEDDEFKEFYQVDA